MLFGVAGSRHDIGDVFFDRVVHIDLVGDILHLVHVLESEHSGKFAVNGAVFDLVHDDDLLVRGRVGDLLLDHETVGLGLGERVGAFLLDGVLGRDDNEDVLRHLVSDPADGDLALLHRFEHGALGLGAGSVHLVEQHEIGENRAEDRLKLPGLLMVDLRADDVAGQQVRRALDPRKLAADGVGDRLRRGGLGETGHRLDQNMPVRHYSRDQRLLEPFLSHDPVGEIIAEFRDHTLGERELFLRDSVFAFKIIHFPIPDPFWRISFFGEFSGCHFTTY